MIISTKLKGYVQFFYFVMILQRNVQYSGAMCSAYNCEAYECNDHRGCALGRQRLIAVKVIDTLLGLRGEASVAPR